MGFSNYQRMGRVSEMNAQPTRKAMIERAAAAPSWFRTMPVQMMTGMEKKQFPPITCCHTGAGWGGPVGMRATRGLGAGSGGVGMGGGAVRRWLMGSQVSSSPSPRLRVSGWAAMACGLWIEMGPMTSPSGLRMWICIINCALVCWFLNGR